jgi:3-oxoacyl-[acyl-carrier-protein] synthase II
MKLVRSQSESNGHRVVITGLGVVSPLGVGKDAYWDSLMVGRSGIRVIEAFDATTYPTRIAGQVKDFDPIAFLSHREARRMDRSCQMILAAAEMALDDAALSLSREKLSRIGVFTGTAVGGQAWALREYAVFREKGLRRINPFTAISTFPNASSAHISGKFGIVGPSVTISSGCASGTLALGYAVDNIRLGRVDTAFVGGTEAPLEPGIFGAYCAARVMTTQNDSPISVPKPFDLYRDGIVLSEGAGVVVCESLEHALSRGAPIYAEVGGWAHKSDSTSMMMINPNGLQVQETLREAIFESGLELQEIDLILAHAAGTKSDDKTEVEVLRSVFGDAIYGIPVTSIKSMLGHTQGACGILEGIAAVLSIAKHTIPPTINCDYLDPECTINIVRNRAVQAKIRSVLMNSFGFGGKYAAIVFCSWERNPSIPQIRFESRLD